MFYFEFVIIKGAFGVVLYDVALCAVVVVVEVRWCGVVFNLQDE